MVLRQSPRVVVWDWFRVCRNCEVLLSSDGQGVERSQVFEHLSVILEERGEDWGVADGSDIDGCVVEVLSRVRLRVDVKEVKSSARVRGVSSVCSWSKGWAWRGNWDDRGWEYLG